MVQLHVVKDTVQRKCYICDSFTEIYGVCMYIIYYACMVGMDAQAWTMADTVDWGSTGYIHALNKCAEKRHKRGVDLYDHPT